jgi:hypothetical protein
MYESGGILQQQFRKTTDLNIYIKVLLTLAQFLKFSVLSVASNAVILPFLTGIRSRVHAAMANRCFGVNPPKAMFGRS